MKNRILKKSFSLAIASIISISSGGLAYASNNINLNFNGQGYVPPSNTKVEDGHIMIPLKWIAEQLGAKVSWDNENKTVDIKVPESRILQSQINSFMYGLEPRTPKEAVDTWLKGVKSRSGSIQYAMLSTNLQEKTYDKFNEGYWNTGGSSPWIDDIVFLKEENINDAKVEYTIEYNLKSSAGIEGKGEKVITIEKNPEEYSSNWYITEIKSKENNCEMYTPAETIIK
ncbi:copper amine oxidase domain-containing protein [Gottschalkia acidurici 9a]|uniref:Copper amine oxidase domain-containing protein n=1 Tax=Gottschalkia acidurici (strain ATCC 7906 / DSM 604 / BCRC 14475 / CIP 104303 / KCTC 5404 / NCIMB 10678 / 9a) TaxID=1128398 RepID=K0B0K2_GOTA9|nr:stalk domain-containing protein [Gottschalkia acidurici]AFS79568.1 copper amine oxidase domain-containing protein [Gottschalkia acidurici 9a]